MTTMSSGRDLTEPGSGPVRDLAVLPPAPSSPEQSSPEQSSPADRPARSGRRSTLLAGAVAAAVAMVAHVAGMWRADIYPFGPRPWAVNDAYNQLLPHKAYLRDLLQHPGSADSLLFTWRSAFGVPYLGDLSTYGASPFNLLLVFVPGPHLTLGVQVISLLQIGTAAAMMAAVLLSMHRSVPWGFAAALGAAYAGCGWVTGDAIVVLSWLDGLVAFPVLLWAALQLAGRRRIVAPVLLVAVSWVANYYTAMMATLAVGLVLVTLLVVDWRGWRAGLAGLGRVVGGFALGIAATSWLVLPTLAAVAGATPGPEASLYQTGWQTMLARFFPGNWTIGSAGLFVGLGTLVLVGAIAFSRRLAVRTRVALPALVVGAVVSMQVPLTQLAWHAFAVPNGSAYREAFAIAGIVVVAAWVGLARGLHGRGPLLGGVALVVALAVAVLPELDARTLLAGGAGLAALAVAIVLGRERVLAGVLLVTILAESAVTSAVIYHEKARYHGAPTSLGASAYAARLAAVPDVPEGERTRVDYSSDNDPLLLGYNGIEYYSSTIPAVTSDAFAGLGLTSWRRRVGISAYDPVGLALLGIHLRADDRVIALATVLPPVEPGSVDPPGGTVWDNRNLLAGVPLYSIPPITVTDAAGTTTTDEPLSSATPATATVRTTCEPGRTLSVITHPNDQKVRGTLDWNGTSFPWVTAQVHTLGTVPADGNVEFTVTGDQLDIRPGDVGCLDLAALPGVVEASRAQGAEVTFGKQRLAVHWNAPQNGEAVLLVTPVPGWGCRVDGQPVEPTSRAGMMSVPVAGATDLACTYRTPGLAAGTAVSLAALAVTALLGLRRRRQAAAPASDRPAAASRADS